MAGGLAEGGCSQNKQTADNPTSCGCQEKIRPGEMLISSSCKCKSRTWKQAEVCRVSTYLRCCCALRWRDMHGLCKGVLLYTKRGDRVRECVRDGDNVKTADEIQRPWLKFWVAALKKKSAPAAVWFFSDNLSSCRVIQQRLVILMCHVNIQTSLFWLTCVASSRIQGPLTWWYIVRWKLRREC